MSTSSPNLEKFKTVENIVKWVGVALAVAAGVFIYIQWKSIWLVIFGFICVAKFFGGELPHVIYHKHRLRRLGFYLSFPLFATIILYFTYQWWGRMWLSTLLGFVLGFILHFFAGFLFNINEIYAEDQQKSRDEVKYDAEVMLDKNPDAVAMKERFTDEEWREIKLLPQLMVGLTSKVPIKQKDGSYKLVFRYYIDPLQHPEKVDNPLLRMMLIDCNLEMYAKMGEKQNNPLFIKSMMNDIGDSEAMAAIAKGEVPSSLTTIENTLNPEEYRSFVRALLELTIKLASPKGEQNPELLQIIFQHFANFAGSKQDLIAMMDGVSLK